MTLAALMPSSPAESSAAATHIVQADSAVTAATLVEAVGGTVTHELRIIRAVGARLTDEQGAELTAQTGISRIWDNRTTELTGKGDKGGKPDGGSGTSHVVETYYPTHLGADQLHLDGIDGTGVTIAVLDSGIFSDNGLKKDPFLNGRILAAYDPIADTLRLDAEGNPAPAEDEHGHGSHVTSIAVSSRQSATGTFNGMAPDADLVVVQAFDATGASTYADVIRGVDWIVANQDSYGIRVLNCSFSTEPQSYYWDDPLNQAIMEAWRSGIVVVASAGNRGPEAMTIGVPGNVPYVVTVGAMTDNYTIESFEDDILASFSSAGPTVEGFVKPEVVAPGGHVKGLMKNNAQIALDHPEFHDGGYYFNMSGTSQAAAFVSGIVALMLEANPELTPDEVKYRLMDSARPATFSGGHLTYSIFQQGAGLVNAYEAVHSSATELANRGLDIDADLAGTQHFGGPADAYEKGNGSFTFFVRDANGIPIEDDGYLWANKYVYEDGFLWADGYLWANGFLWADGYLWANGYLWADGYLWANGFLWADLYTEALFTESWVPQE